MFLPVRLSIFDKNLYIYITIYTFIHIQFVQSTAVERATAIRKTKSDSTYEAGVGSTLCSADLVQLH